MLAHDPVKVVLLRPPVEVLHKFSKPVECLAIGYLAAPLREDRHDVTLLDGMLHDWTEERTVSEVLRLEPDIVGITIVLNHFPSNVGEIVASLRRSGYLGLILIGGHAVSFIPERILSAHPEIDGVVCGEGELALRAVASAVAAGRDWTNAPGLASRVRTSSEARRILPARIRDLDEIAWPARDLVPELLTRDGLVCISTSRGCQARCSFCSVPRFYGLEAGKPMANGTWLGRSVTNVANEVLDLYRRFALRELLIVDDEFFGGCATGHDRAVALADELAALAVPLHFALSARAENISEHVLAKLRAAGLAHVFIGLEAGTDEDLKFYAKGHSVSQNRLAVQIVKALGLSFQPGFMLFNPRSTIDRVRANLEFLGEIGELKPVTINSALDPHFGAPITAAFRRDDALDDRGLQLTARWRDARVHAAKAVAEIANEGFRPFMNTIAAMQSSVTYEWRRVVPGRSKQVQRVLDAFEESVNCGFTSVVVDAVESLARSSPNIDEICTDAKRSIAELNKRFQVALALTLQCVEQNEGKIRYWTQLDLIRGVASHAIA
jgi:anaerobic magnesium-protoporphyrin IX monomethyl ester cyclase